jgi:hypothetical protein
VAVAGSSVIWLFIGASSQPGEFESGVVASLLGAAPAAVVGGVGTLLIVGLWGALFPDVRRADRLPKSSGQTLSG